VQRGTDGPAARGARRQLASPRVLQWSASGKVAPESSLFNTFLPAPPAASRAMACAPSGKADRAGETCDACERLLAETHLVMTAPSMADKTFAKLHADCYVLWNAELNGGVRQPSNTS
jgi:hypothetical protein